MEIDPEAALREALAVALDGTASRETRWTCVSLLLHAREPHYVKKLLPLLQDESPGRFEDQKLCDEAARAIGEICAVLDPKKPDHAEAIQLAREALNEMLRGPRGLAAVESLAQMEGDEPRQAEFLVQVASDRSLAFTTRRRALERIARSGDRSSVKKLLPLLDDTTKPRHELLSIADHAANTAAELLDRKRPVDYSTPAAARAEIIQRVRAWVEDE
ncbi:MAG: hypothetical protein HUU20_10955 [Pirellulales bacterium]|nr:hypothetical protein [Pirellulales bacterium]